MSELTHVPRQPCLKSYSIVNSAILHHPFDSKPKLPHGEGVWSRARRDSCRHCKWSKECGEEKSTKMCSRCPQAGLWSLTGCCHCCGSSSGQGLGSKQWLSCGSDHSLKPAFFLQHSIRRKQGVTLEEKNLQILKLLEDTEFQNSCQVNIQAWIFWPKRLSDPLCGLCCGPSQLRHLPYLSPNAPPVSRSLTWFFAIFLIYS